MTFTALINPEEGDKAGGVSKKVRKRRGKTARKMGVYSSIRYVCCQVCQYVCSQISVSVLIYQVLPYLSQRYDSLYVGVADVEMRDFLRLPGRCLHASWVLDVPVQSLGWHQVDHIIHFKFQLHHLIWWTFQSTETEEGNVIVHAIKIFCILCFKNPKFYRSFSVKPPSDIQGMICSSNSKGRKSLVFGTSTDNHADLPECKECPQIKIKLDLKTRERQWNSTGHIIRCLGSAMLKTQQWYPSIHPKNSTFRFHLWQHNFYIHLLMAEQCSVTEMVNYL